MWSEDSRGGLAVQEGGPNVEQAPGLAMEAVDQAASEAEALRAFAASGLPQVFERLVELHRDAVWDLARRILRDPGQAEDCAQETFLALYLHAAQGPAGRSLRSWLLGVARHLALNHRRAAARRKRREEERGMDGPGRERGEARPEQRVLAQEEAAALRARVDELPEEFQLPVVLHYHHGLSQPEVAATLGLPEGTVRSRIARALERLRAGLSRDRSVAGAVGGALVGVSVEQALSAMALPAAPAQIGSLSAMQTLAAQSAAAAAQAAGLKSAAACAGSAVLMKVAALVAALVLAGAGIAVLPKLTPHEIAADPPEAQRSHAAREAPGGPPPPPPPLTTAPPAQRGAELERILALKPGLRFQRAHPCEALYELRVRTGLDYALPAGLERAFIFSLDRRDFTVAEVLDRLVEAGGLKLERRGDMVVLWQTADEARLRQLEAQLGDADAARRAEAVADLSLLSDPRIYPLLFRALEDREPVVTFWALRCLRQRHLRTLCYGEGVAGAAQVLLKGIERNPPQVYGSGHGSGPGVGSRHWFLGADELAVFAATRRPEAYDWLARELTRGATGVNKLAICYSLELTRDPRAAGLLKPLAFGGDLSAVTALTGLRTPEAREALVELAAGNQLGLGLREQLPGFYDDRIAQAALPGLRSNDEMTLRRAAGLLAPYRRKDAVEIVLERATQKNFSHQSAFLLLLAESGDPRAVEFLKAQAHKENPKGNVSYYVLARCNTPEAVVALRELLRDPPPAKGAPSESSRILNALGQMQLPEVVPVLEEACQDPKSRQAALWQLCLCREDAARPVIERLLAEGAADVRQTYLSLVGGSRDPKTSELLDRYWPQPESRALLVATQFAMCLGHDRRLLARFLGLAESADGKVQTALANLLDRAASYGYLGPATREGVTVAAKLSVSEAPQARSRAATLLGNLCHPAAVPALVRLLDDPDASVRQAAAQACAHLHDPRLFDGLLKLLQDPDAKVRGPAAIALGRLKDGRAITGLAQSLGDRDAEVARFAANALGSVGLKTAVPHLVVQLNSAQRERRKDAAMALGRIGTPEAIRLLARHLREGNQEDKQSAAFVLTTILPRWPDGFPAEERKRIEEEAKGLRGQPPVAPAALPSTTEPPALPEEF